MWREDGVWRRRAAPPRVCWARTGGRPLTRAGALALALFAGLATLRAAAAGDRGVDPPGAAFAPCVACQVTWEAARGEYTDAAWGTLEAGEVVTSHVETGSRGTGDAGQVVASVFVERPPEPIWSVLLDFSRHPEFLPNVHETRVRRWDGQRVWIQQHLRVFLTDIRYGAIWRLDPPRGRAHFALDEDVPHDIAASHGSWELVPTPDRRRTLLRYSAEVDTGRPLPAVVERMLTQRSLPRVVRGLRDAVHERFPRAPLDASREATPP